MWKQIEGFKTYIYQLSLIYFGCWILELQQSAEEKSVGQVLHKSLARLSRSARNLWQAGGHRKSHQNTDH